MHKDDSKFVEKKDIERMRDKLNKAILKNTNNQEILKISRELDELILKYLKNT